MSSNRLIVVFGSGPGIGVGVASLFAERGFNKVALLSRNAERLQEDVASVKEGAKGKSVDVRAYPADLADPEGLKSVLARVESDFGKPEVVVYNASHLTKSALGEYSWEQVEIDLRVRYLLYLK